MMLHSYANALYHVALQSGIALIFQTVEVCAHNLYVG
eukprot:COSAG06_NODE_532_length_14551_cov_16.536466_4_plen_37_part_00